MSEWLIEVSARWLSVLIAALALFISIYVTRRGGQWRNSEQGQAMEKRVTEIERDCSIIKVRLDGMPSRADLEGLRSEVRALGRDMSRVESGVERIEQFLMEKKV